MNSTQYISKSGYVGAITVVISAFTLIGLKETGYIAHIYFENLLLLVFIVFVSMLVSEYILRNRYNKTHKIKTVFTPLSESNTYLIRSTLYRFITLSLPLVFLCCFTSILHYFNPEHSITLISIFYKYVIGVYFLFGFPYLFFTLKYRGDLKYEFNDYAILTLIGVRSLFKKNILSLTKNRRVQKVLLVYVVNFFFLTLMVLFISNEYSQLEPLVHKVLQTNYWNSHWFVQVATHYELLFHLLFLIDVTIAMIGYSFASRWLNNRTKSVDRSILGWTVALVCYPPFNAYMGFLSYNRYDTHDIIHGDIAIAMIMVLLLIAYSIYVWGTVALGFKFSNLTNRGIISHGPYKYVRHPAYTAKNFAWFIDNTYVLTNLWATLAFFTWTTIYILRALTEETHLSKDQAYQRYKNSVPYKFIPKLI